MKVQCPNCYEIFNSEKLPLNPNMEAVCPCCRCVSQFTDKPDPVSPLHVLELIDPDLLKQQCLWLATQNSEEAIGLLNFLDILRDKMVEDGIFTEDQVFNILNEV